MQKLITEDIIESIKANQVVGNITQDDANELMGLTRELFHHIYEHYEELGGVRDMKPLLDGAMELPTDKYRRRIDELEEQHQQDKQQISQLLERIQKLEQQQKQ